MRTPTQKWTDSASRQDGLAAHELQTQPQPTDTFEMNALASRRVSNPQTKMPVNCSFVAGHTLKAVPDSQKLVSLVNQTTPMGNAEVAVPIMPGQYG